jgi:outer membrane protein OmpA-like peptidoglycan-associated protein
MACGRMFAWCERRRKGWGSPNCNSGIVTNVTSDAGAGFGPPPSQRALYAPNEYDREFLMASSRSALAASNWLATSGLVVGATALGIGATTDAASAATGGTTCTGGASLVSSGVCQIVVTSSKHWSLPAGVKSLQILTVGGGGGGGGGTTYGAGGGGGGGEVSVCTTSLVDLTGHLDISIGGGGAGGANGSGHLYNNTYGGEYGFPGSTGHLTTVTDGRTLCIAAGGSGGEPGYNYYTSDLPVTPLYGGGGSAGNGNAGGSATGLAVNNSDDCTFTNWEYNLTASGGGGNGQTGFAPADGTSGAGGEGSTPGTSLFDGDSSLYGGGGGGGSGNDCETSDTRGDGGAGGGGDGGGLSGELTGPNQGTSTHAARPHTVAVPPPANGVANSGGGGGGGNGQWGDQYPQLDGVAGANGGNGVVVIRFAAISTSPLLATVYFATASSTLTNGDKTTLTAFVDHAISQDKTVLRIEGFTDHRGSKPYNQALSTARANSTAAYVRSVFAAQDVSASITAVGKGISNAHGNLALDRVATLSATLKPTAT